MDNVGAPWGTLPRRGGEGHGQPRWWGGESRAAPGSKGPGAARWWVGRVGWSEQGRGQVVGQGPGSGGQGVTEQVPTHA